MKRRWLLVAVATASLGAAVGCGGSAEPGERGGATATPGLTATETTPAEAGGIATALATATPGLAPETTSSPAPTATQASTPTPTASPSPATATSTPMPATPPPTTPTPSDPNARQVEIRGYAFPFELQVGAGTRVIWTNRDSVVHDVVARDGSWGSGLFAAGSSYGRVFDAPGRFTYYCTIHPYMQAAVIVE